MNFLMVFVGGGLGAVCRYTISLLVGKSANGFPTPTFLANVISCIILGFLLSYFMANPGHDRMKLLLATGFCGGFSTFSTFSAENFQLLQNGNFLILSFYVLASVLICVVCIGIGWKLGQL